MYLKRKIDSFLEQWKDKKDRKPLIIKGARQIGKTESIRHFAATHYSSVVEINFIDSPVYKTITADGYSPDKIIKAISRINNAFRFLANDTLIFFDEIQSHPDIATALKFFCQDGRFDVICSGSLLGINYKQISSNSVGYREEYEMCALDFEEFLHAKGYGDNVIDEMRLHLADVQPFGAAEMAVFDGLFLDFSILGGMPEIVRNYVERGTFEGVLNLQRQLVGAYRDDVRKYVQGLEQTRIMNVLDHIPAQLGKENKKFVISGIERGARKKDYWGCVEWLREAGIVNVCYCLGFPELPLKGNYDSSKYKLYFADSGLLVSQLDDGTQDDIRAKRNLHTYKGGLFENIIAEALKKSGAELYYYKREDSTLEEDFFLRSRSSLVPVEVKAGNNRSKSLRTLISSDHYPDIKFGLKLSSANIGFENGFYTIPQFCAFLVKDWLLAI
ncbi:MAG: ATP-binding protein [Kiritimatiellae bacterium]|nr:ATP-binding protein [Kiritimatiellia bacterium]